MRISGPEAGLIAMLLAIPILGIVVGGAVKILRPVIEAWSHKNLGGGELGADNLRGDVEQPRLEVDQLRQELADTHERLDFTERLLARGRDAASEAKP